MIGTPTFVESIRLKYLPENVDKKLPQQRSMGSDIAPGQVLAKAALVLNCDLEMIRHSRRIPKSMKNDRELLVYLVWKICRLPNEESGRLFGMTYSAISHILSSMRTRMQKETDLQARYNSLYSLCKM